MAQFTLQKALPISECEDGELYVIAGKHSNLGMFKMFRGGSSAFEILVHGELIFDNEAKPLKKIYFFHDFIESKRQYLYRASRAHEKNILNEFFWEI